MAKSNGPERIARLQRQMHRLTQYRLTALHRRQADLRGAEREAVIAFDEGVGAGHGGGSFLHRRLRAIAVELREIAADISAQARILAEQARRAKTAEHIAVRLSAEAANVDARKQLSEIVEGAVAHRKARLP